MEKLAFCIVAHQEKDTIYNVLKACSNATFGDNTAVEIFVYLDAPDDATINETEKFVRESKYKTNLIVNKQWLGKKAGINKILELTNDYDSVIFLDGDTKFKENSFENLYKCLVRKGADVVYPRSEVITKDEHHKNFKRALYSAFSKSSKYKFQQDKYRYFSGRLFCARRNAIHQIPKHAPCCDFYLNLIVPWEKIKKCEEAVVYFKPPVTTKELFINAMRMGARLKNLRSTEPPLWEEQKRRVNMFDYFVLGLSGPGYWKSLTLLEFLMYVYSRVVICTGMLIGFLKNNSVQSKWSPLSSTK